MFDFAYPLNSNDILKNKKKYKKALLADGSHRVKKNIAILGGSTVDHIKDILELFLLDNGIEPCFYQSEYGMYWEDAMFGNPELDGFSPDLVYIHTTARNLEPYFPSIADSAEKCAEKLNSAKEHFSVMWQALGKKFSCPVIQNNFELPHYRLLGNLDGADIHGATYFVRKMNDFVAEYAVSNQYFYLNDVNFVSSCYGIDKWSDLSSWYMFKYAMCLDAIPDFAFNLANIIKSIYGKSKKALVLDMDNTLWGGIVGDDGVEGLELGNETPVAQGYTEFQKYVKKHRDMGIMLTISSKNDYENAIAGLKHPDSVLSPDDFLNIKANWEPKHLNIASIAKELNIMADSLVFVDDNPAERAIVKDSLPCAVPEIDSVENYIRILDRNGYFEAISISEDDIKRNEMYKANAAREKELSAFEDYGDYLVSLDMHAEIDAFSPVYIQRIAQLTNKSNQFNLTTRRYSSQEISAAMENNAYITLYGKLTDKFGDNGVVSVVLGETEEDKLHIKLWLMSCRVLKRDMEYAMLDTLVEKCRIQGIKTIYGYYYPTAKNNMVRHLYKDFGFELLSEDETGNTVWSLQTETYEKKNRYIKVN
ncbi:MAG: HAD-IIIC family phosphatase [Ruminococcaceae bacterium]|nr:HAD-IIIC family phosphatase [Oscillospiraceae bacterium]